MRPSDELSKKMMMEWSAVRWFLLSLFAGFAGMLFANSVWGWLAMPAVLFIWGRRMAKIQERLHK